ncbi:hypothetical protein [Desulfoluna sp.]|uniref:hypothetical protein n=1 Tax=Desulfoluna sp. TaxID=2045199 RepID=UPI0026164B39|nr:hypothetical protein [Desulfoluna sp.]
MVRLGRYLWVLCAIFFMGACQSLTLPRASVPFPDALQTRALALEDRGDFTEALRYWEAASAVAAEKRTTLQSLRRATIQGALTAADQALAQGEMDQQKVHLLKVLRMAPAHAMARQRLRESLSRRLVLPYTVQGGESTVTIAGRVYKNVQLASLVEVLHGPGTVAGEVLWLPRVEASLVAAQFSYRRAIFEARRQYKSETWDALLTVSEEILSYAPDDQEALYLKNTATHNMARELFEAGRYPEALVMYRRVDVYFRNEKPQIEAILSIQKNRREAAQVSKNAALLKEATLLEQQGALVASRKVLNTIDPGFSGRDALERRLTKRMNQKAEAHYRIGVRLFLEENLVGAIAEWKKSLELNPDFVKAGEGVANAGYLLEKVKGIQLEKRGKKP